MKTSGMLTTAVLSATGVLALAAPAWATFYGNTTDYGHISSSSTCSVPGSAGYCSIRYTDNSAVSRPPVTAYVRFCSGISSDTTIQEALADNVMTGRYVGVIWGGSGAVGTVNCH